MKRAALFLLPGMLFGAGLVVSGMTDPAKVLNFLDVSGTFDPTLACVMGGALFMFVLLGAMFRRRGKTLLGGTLPGRPDRTITGRLLAGAVLFGLGWGLLGFCPGPAITNLGAMYVEALIFVPAMLAGMWLAHRFARVRPRSA